MTSPSFPSPDFLNYLEYPYFDSLNYAELLPRNDDPLDIQGNSDALSRPWPDYTIGLDRIDSAVASRSSTVSSSSNRCVYRGNNTDLVDLGDGFRSYSEHVPEASDLLNLPGPYHHEASYSVAPKDVENKLPEQSHTDRLECPQGCGARLACWPNVKRHLKEQHQCPHVSCTHKLFRTKMERDKHKETHVEDGLGFQCGSCGLKGLRKRFARPDKLRDHFIQVHRMPDDFAFKRFQCMEPSCHPGSSGGTFFTSRSDLERHTLSKHSNGAGGALSSDTENLVLSRNAARNPDICKKHYLPRESLPQPKRYMSVEPRISLSDPRPSSASFVMTLIEPIEILDICNLVEDARLSRVVHELNSIKVSAVLIRSTMAIQLCGAQSSADMDRAKTLFGTLLPVKPKTVLPASRVRARRRSRPRPFNSAQSIQLLPIDASQNKDAIDTWKSYIAPALTEIFEKSRIGDSYSATLVRQKGSLGEFEPVIRIQSVRQIQIMRDIIRKKIDGICVKNHRCTIPVVFSKGGMVPLVGGPSQQEFAEDPTDDRDIPHELRYYKRPLMGVSIGMTQCEHASATLGGFILVDNQTVMLTVQHLIKSARDCEYGCGAGDLDNSLSSPARSDVEYLREKLEIHLEKLSLMLQRSDSGTDRVNVDAVRTQFPEVFVHLKHIKSFQAHLTKPVDEYKLGKVIDHSDENDLVHPVRVRGGCDKIMRHKMDWAIYEIQKEREGKNRFRHPVGIEVRVEDIENEITNPYGTGQACEDWKEFEVGEVVYYVGSCSGYREGIINETYGVFKHKDIGVSQEWSIIPSIPVEDESEVQGDSGAWIISKKDHKLIGLLWAYDAGTIIFTPIGDVFDHIARKRGGSPHIQVAPLDPARATQPRTLIPVSRTKGKKKCLKRSFFPREFRRLPLISHITETSMDSVTHFRPSTPNPSSSRSSSSTPILTFSGSSTPDYSTSRSPSPTPSLTSSISTLSDPLSPSICPLNVQSTVPLVPFEKLELPFRSLMSPFASDLDSSKYPTQIMSEDLIEIV